MKLAMNLEGEDIMTTLRACEDILSGKMESSGKTLLFASNFMENIGILMTMINTIKEKDNLNDEQLNEQVNKWSGDTEKIMKLLLRPEYRLSHLILIIEMFKMSIHGTAFIGSLPKDKRIIIYGREITPKGEDD